MARQKLPSVHYDAIAGSSCRVLYQHQAGMLNNVEWTFETEKGKVVITMPFEVARSTINDAIAAYQSIMQPLRIARNVPFGQ